MSAVDKREERSFAAFPLHRFMKDIENVQDIQTFVNEFYLKVRNDALLSPVFAAKIPDEAWPVHLQRMYAFWNAILFAEKGFDGNPMQKHMSLPIEEKHFSQWLSLFNATIDENFTGPKAAEAKQRARSIAQIMNFKITSLRA
ncbi:MAG TPA: group III truncated hemoglobin [Flavisolibacter sp.]|nr:group III truncated hemoglobin [Flavisolibacter sp.]